LSRLTIIVGFTFLKRQSKAKRWAPAYSRELRRVRREIQRAVKRRRKSGCQRVRSAFTVGSVRGRGTDGSRY